MAVSRAAVEELYAEGVAAVADLAAPLDAASWDTPVCGTWSAADVARHLVGVAGWYHGWLDRAEAGDRTAPFPPGELAAQNELALAAVAELDPSAAIERFTAEAGVYLERTRSSWDLPIGFPYGTVTVGLHVAVAATEWHLHAWDLSALAGARHRPSHPTELFLATGECFTRSEGTWVGALQRRLLPLAARRAPWDAMLHRSGRREVL